MALLSKQEIDMLLCGIRDGVLPQGDDPDSADAVERDYSLYDLSFMERIDQLRLPGINRINEGIGRAAAPRLGVFAGRAVAVAPEGVSVAGYAELAGESRNPAVVCVFAMTPLEGTGALIIDAALAEIIVELYFGGETAGGLRGNFVLTPATRPVIERAASTLLDVISEAWKGATGAAFSCVRFERWGLNPGGIGPESMHLSSFRVEAAGGTGRFQIAIPLHAIAAMRHRLVNLCDETERRRWTGRLTGLLMETPLVLTAELGTALISAGDLLGLRPGDIIEIDKKAGEPLPVTAGGQPVFLAAPGAVGGRYAVRITGIGAQGI
ncbi:MAG: FliM/FliN family flagellar motor switch protein [Deltaproteobacteria bacterium]|nr:FliM/FliN family flagellar motor switch protein [Deltaproteobacteria bacterium]